MWAMVRNFIKQVAKDIPTSGTYERDVKKGGPKKNTIDSTESGKVVLGASI